MTGQNLPRHLAQLTEAHGEWCEFLARQAGERDERLHDRRAADLQDAHIVLREDLPGDIARRDGEIVIAQRREIGGEQGHLLQFLRRAPHLLGHRRQRLERHRRHLLRKRHRRHRRAD